MFTEFIYIIYINDIIYAVWRSGETWCTHFGDPAFFLGPECTSKGNIKIVLWVCSLGKAPLEYQTWCENTVLGPKIIKLCFKLESRLTHIQLNAFGQIRSLYPLTTIDEMLSEGIQSIS